MLEETPSDVALLQLHAAGDPDAFGELVRRHRDRLWAVAVRTLGNPEDAADALQDALLSAYRSAAAGGFRGESAATTWLHRIVVNACIDRMRRRQARPTVPLTAADSAQPVAPDEYERMDLSHVVLDALRQLPPEQAAALVLVDLEGFSVGEAAAVLDVAEGTVKSRCSRARVRLLPLLAALRPQHRRNPDRAPDVPPGGGSRSTSATDTERTAP